MDSAESVDKNALRVVGVTGLPASGKGTFVVALREVLKDRGITLSHFSLSDEVRGEVRRRGLSPERPVLRVVANALRHSYGNAILADMVVRRIWRELAGEARGRVVVVDAIRNPGEVEALRTTFGSEVLLVALEAPVEMLVGRLASRARPDEARVVVEEAEAARQMLSAELGEGEEPHGHDVSACIAMADVRIDNSGTLDALRQRVHAFAEEAILGRILASASPKKPNREEIAAKGEDRSESLLVEYLRWPEAQRISYLERHVVETTDLSADFLGEALARESAPLARWHLIRATGVTRVQAAVPLLVDVCEAPNHEFGHTSLHAIASWSLGQIGGASVSWLLGALVEAETDEVKRCLADALGETRSPRAIQALRQLFCSGAHEVKLWAALALAKIGDPARELLYGLMEETQTWPERVLLIDAIEKVEGPRAFSLFRKILETGGAEEKVFILEKYGKDLDESFEGQLKRLAQAGNDRIATLATRLLERMHDKRRA